ncbi:MAG: glycoside hydrolase family 99-like domain-containing protein [Tepidisphaeraceae bacterium]
MNRREFLSAMLAGAVSASGASTATDAASPDAKAVAKPPRPPELAPPPPGVEYFTQERLEKAIDTTISTDGIDFQAVCYVCNLWHPTPVLEKWFGKGFTEWEMCRRAKALYEGHYQPKRPSWGYYKEAEVEWATREIDLAASSGIDVFMVDWYWHDGAMFLHEWLESAFLKSPSREKIKFAVMWANHHWNNFYLAPEEGEEATLLPQVYSDADIDRLGAYLVEKYFTQPNYWKVGGKPLFAVYWTTHLIKHFGAAKLHKIFDTWEERARKAGLQGIHFQAASEVDATTPIIEAGFSSATDYHTFAKVIPFGGRTAFAQGAEASIERWKSMPDIVKVPYFPQCPVGFDNSPRYGKRTHIFVNRTADQYERLLIAAKHFIAARKTDPPAIYMGAWNEWTEDHYLLPDDVYGYSYLEAVRRQFA